MKEQAEEVQLLDLDLEMAVALEQRKMKGLN
jgi:hypothetical protein